MLALSALVIAFAAAAAEGTQLLTTDATCRPGVPSDHDYLLCLGDEQIRRARTSPRGSPSWHGAFIEALGFYRQALKASNDVEDKRQALQYIAKVYGPGYLDEAGQLINALSELLAVTPSDPQLVYRLSRVQEQHGLVDSAEETLLGARRLYPETAEYYKWLAQFYSRRAAALAAAPRATAELQGTIGASSEPPRRLDKPVYSREALAAGARGPVWLELTIDEAGRVVSARPVRSVPLLDDAAMAVARHWTYEPKVVNGRGVPVTFIERVDFQMPE